MNNNNVPTENTSVVIENTSVPIENTNIPTENTSVSTENTSIPTENKTVNTSVNLKIEYLFDKMLSNTEFSKKLEQSIENIMKDGKIDQFDIPDIIFIITDVLNQQSNLNVTIDDINELVEKLYRFIVAKYNLIPDPTQAANFDRLMASSIRLLLLQPKVKKACNSFLSKLNVCCK
jgi:hypothetical protein